MSAQTTPIAGFDLSTAAEKRHEMITECLVRLQHLAYRAIHLRHLRNDEFVVVCIKVDTPWRDIVDLLMPNANWQKYRDLGADPVARGTATFSICKMLADRIPSIAVVLMEKPTANTVKCIALDEGGCTVYEIQPTKDSNSEED